MKSRCVYNNLGMKIINPMIADAIAMAKTAPAEASLLFSLFN